MNLQSLDPFLRVTRGPITFSAMAAAHTSEGLRALVLVANGSKQAAETVLISSSAARAEHGRLFAQATGSSVADSVSALLDLVAPIEARLQLAPPEVRWADPVPLLAIPSLPPFPLDVLPDWVRAQVVGVAEFTQTPPDLAAMLALAVLATAAQRLAVVEVVPDYYEPLCLYILAAAESGERKSAVYRALAAPIYAFEQALTERVRPQVAGAQTRRRILEQALKRAEAEASAREAGEAERQRAQALAEQLAGTPIAREPVLAIQDSTPEMVVAELDAQGGCLAALDAEGGLLDTMAGRYGESGVNLDPLLKAHAGDAIRTGRIGRGRIAIAQPMLTIGIAPQPEVLVTLSEKDGARRRGLLGRFFYAMPASRKGARTVQRRGMAPAARETFETQITALLGEGYTEEGSPVSERRILRLTEEARDAWEAFHDWIEPQLVADGPLGGTHGWAEKVPGQTARLAALFHIADWGAVRWQAEAVRRATVERAIRLARDYLLPHAVVALRLMGADPATNDARKILAWIERTGRDTFSARDVFADLRRHFDDPEHVKAPLALLVAHHILADISEPRQGPGRKPTPVYATNPRVLHPSQNT